METLMGLIDAFNAWAWGWPLLIIIAGGGIIYSVVLKFVQFRRLGYIMRSTFGKITSKETVGEGTVTPFQAAASSLAGTIGVGNIAGVAVAVSLGGAGALFWMWIIAVFAAVLKYAEYVLSLRHREKDPEADVYRGGFMYMVKNGLGESWKWLAGIWAFLFFVQFLIGGAVQSNTIADATAASFGLDELVVGIILAVLIGLVLLGGIRRIAKAAEKLVPIMAVFYFIGAVAIILLNITMVPAAIVEIVRDAFTGAASAGGFAGATVMMALRHGIARGLYSNEAGMGTGPVAHAAATTDHPSRQGMWAIAEVFIDTIVMCTLTGLVIVITGTIPSGEQGVSLTALAFAEGLPGAGDLIVTIAVMVFGYTTILLAGFYSETGAVYCFGNKIVMPFRLVYLIVLIGGAVIQLELVWGLFDSFMALTVATNVIVIVALRKDVARLTKEFFGKEFGSATE